MSSEYLNPYAELPPPSPFQAGFDTYLSVFTYRYGTEPMRRIWSQETFWGNVRRIWIAVAETQQEAGLVTAEEVADLKQHINTLSVERIFQIEQDRRIGTGHDVAAAIAEFSEKAPLGGRILHKGMTSEDVLSNAEMMQIKGSFALIRPKLVDTLRAFSDQIEKHKDLVCMGYTHLQAAEPITMGYRFALSAQDLLANLHDLDNTVPLLKGKGIKGAVGTSATFVEMLKGTGMSADEFERRVMERVGLDYVTISDQTYPRDFLFMTEGVLSGIGQSLHKFALTLQILQSSFVNEVSEPRRRGQIGSSAMPHKQNPINSENIDALTEVLPGQLFSAWMTGAFVTLERTLRDSAGRRSWLPESFLIIDEALNRTSRVVSGLGVHEAAVKTNLRKFAPFCATEIILDKLVQAGMDRKMAHAILVSHAEEAVEAVRVGKRNPMRKYILSDPRIISLLGQREVEQIFRDIYHHVGNAPEHCLDFLELELYPAIKA